MLKQARIFGAAMLATTLSTGVMAQDVTADTVVATVGDTEITMGEIIIARTQLPAQYAQLPVDVLFNGLIDQLVQQQLLADVAGDMSARSKYSLSNERRSLLAAQVISSIADNSVTEADVQAAYDERFKDAEEIPEFNAAHLLVETEEEAIAAKARIDEGAAFADVARDVSTGPTGPNGGNLGWFAPGAMVPEFEDAVKSLEVGGVSEPFQTQFGWHVATLLDTRVQPRPTIDELRPQIAADLQEKAITARLDELLASADVTKPEEGQFDPALIDANELLD